MIDERPEPKYGQYAPGPPPVPPAPVVVAAPVPPQRRSRDVVLTTVLLLVGVYDVVVSFGQFADLGSALVRVYQQQGLGTFTALQLASSMGFALNIVRVVLLVAAIVVSLALIRRGRIAFWVPLTAGVLAAIVVIVCILVVVLTDPALSLYVGSQSPRR